MEDLISRQVAINKCKELLYESALNNVGYVCKEDEVFVDIAENRIETWLNEVPSLDYVPIEKYEALKGSAKVLTDICFEKEYVVRCRDCKHGLKVEAPITGIFCTRFGAKDMAVEYDDYCSYGEEV